MPYEALTNEAAEIIAWASVYLKWFLSEDPTDEEIERATRIAFIAARTSVALARGLEESARSPKA